MQAVWTGPDGSKGDDRMRAVELAELAGAAQLLPLPSGAGWGFSAVGAVDVDQLPPEIRGAALRRQRGFAAGRRAAMAALVAAGHQPSGPPGIGADRLPLWPVGWHGSISHTDDLAVALVASGYPVLGVDIEALMSPQVASEVAAAIMPEATAGQAAMPPEQELCRVFSAKEALYKALYPHTRQFRDFSAARAFWGEGTCADKLRPLFLQLSEDWGQGWRAGTILKVHQVIAGGHVLSLIWHDKDHMKKA